MTSSDAISRQLEDPDGLDFESLRKQGIASAQDLSGKLWTDYNVHDPGVTILEQACFAITELAYQTRVPVADQLADYQGLIDYHRHGLLKPHEIFPCGPVTPDDYSKVLIDAVPEIDRIEFKPIFGKDQQSTFRYLAKIRLLKLLEDETISAERKHQIINKVRDEYARIRNLGEVLDIVIVEDPEPCFIIGMIEANGKVASHPEVHAEIFFQCSRRISSNIVLERYESVAAADCELVDIFNGPLTKHGYIGDIDSSTNEKILGDLNGLVAQIHGVKKISSLQLVDSNNIPLTDGDLIDKCYYLKFPEENEKVLRVYYSASNAAAAEEALINTVEGKKQYLEKTKEYLRKLEFEYRAFRSNKLNAGSFYELPKGRVKQQHSFYSIQNQFPDIYGINAYGVPSNRSRERKAYAKQLKAYLYPIEQIMSNYQVTLQEMHKFFSISDADSDSRFVEYLGNSAIPGIEDIYQVSNDNQKRLSEGSTTLDRVLLQEIMSSLNRFYDGDDHKNRAIDTLLALYAEEFPREGLLTFNCYRQDDPSRWMLEIKLRYLREIGDLSARRNGAFSTRERYWDTKSQAKIAQKIAILLGIVNFSRVGSLRSNFAVQNIRWLNDKVLAQAPSAIPFDSIVTINVPRPDAMQLHVLKNWRRNLDTPLSISSTLLTHGVNLQFFRLAENNGYFRVYFHLQEQNLLLQLSGFDNQEKAVEYIYRFRKIIIELNVESEGFHLIEHQLLRQRNVLTKSSEEDDFFLGRISIVFPAWTARFANKAFRAFAQKIVCNQLPAHILPDFYWLDFSAMEEFETRYHGWLKALLVVEKQFDYDQGQNPMLQEFNRASNALVEWLQTVEAVQDRWV